MHRCTAHRTRLPSPIMASQMPHAPQPFPPQPTPTLDTTKRTMLLSALVSLVPAIATPPSTAGDSNALADFLRSRQAANGGSSLLAPIRSARLRLQDAQGTIVEGAGEADLARALGLVRAASCNCYVFDAELVWFFFQPLRVEGCMCGC